MLPKFVTFTANKYIVPFFGYNTNQRKFLLCMCNFYTIHKMQENGLYTLYKNFRKSFAENCSNNFKEENVMKKAEKLYKNFLIKYHDGIDVLIV